MQLREQARARLRELVQVQAQEQVLQQQEPVREHPVQGLEAEPEPGRPQQQEQERQLREPLQAEQSEQGFP